jgi:uncharacterized membrane protein
MTAKRKPHLKRIIITGALIVLPVIITVGLLKILFNAVTAYSTPAVRYLVTRFWGTDVVLPRFVYPFMGLLVTVLIVILTGVIGTNVFGKKLIGIFDHLVLRIPLVKSIYSSAQQLLKGLALPREGAFKGVVLVEFPFRGSWGLAFKTGETRTTIGSGEPFDLVSVFIPTTPNPTSGFLLWVPREKFIEVDISVEEAIKIVVSGGIVGVKEMHDLGAAESGELNPPART